MRAESVALQVHRQVQRAPPPRERGRQSHGCVVGQRPRQRRVSRPPSALLCKLVPRLIRRVLSNSYLPVAQNGFVNLPRELKIDAGYYGSGFYFTRYPRCATARVAAGERAHDA